MVAHRAHYPEAVGSIPASAPNIFLDRLSESDAERALAPSGLPWHSFRISTLTANAEPGEFTADVFTYARDSHPDFFGDVINVKKGAFADVISKQNDGEPWPIIWTHMESIPPIGVVLNAEDRAKTVRLHAKLRIADEGISGQYARSVREGWLDNSLTDFSVSVMFDRDSMETEELGDGPYGMSYRFIFSKVVQVREVSPTLAGRMPGARLIDAFANTRNHVASNDRVEAIETDSVKMPPPDVAFSRLRRLRSGR